MQIVLSKGVSERHSPCYRKIWHWCSEMGGLPFSAGAGSTQLS